MCKWLNNIAEGAQPWTWLALRVLAGIMFFLHGLPKLFGEKAQSFMTAIDPITGDLVGMGLFGVNLGINMMFIAGLIEVFGGILLVLGLWTRWAAIFSALLMVMAYTHAHLGWNPLVTRGETAVLYLLIWLVVFAYGAGRYSLDALLYKEVKKAKRVKK